MLKRHGGYSGAQIQTVLSERAHSFARVYVARLPWRLQGRNIDLTLHEVRSARPK